MIIFLFPLNYIIYQYSHLTSTKISSTVILHLCLMNSVLLEKIRKAHVSLQEFLQTV